MRVVRSLVRVMVVLVMLIVGATTAAVVASQTAWFRHWLRGYIVAEAHQFLNGDVSIERLNGNLFTGIALDRVAISMDGEPVVSVDQIALTYNLFHIVTRGVSADEIQLKNPVIHLRRDQEGWSISRLVKRQEQEADRTGPRYPIAIDSIRIYDGSVSIDDQTGMANIDLPDRIEDFDANLTFNYEPVRYSVDVNQLSFRSTGPAIGLNTFSGGIAVKDDTVFLSKLALRLEESVLSVDGAIESYLTTPTLKLRASSEKISLPELARVIPALAKIPLQPAFELALDGPLDSLGIDGSVRSAAGDARMKLVADATAPGLSAKGDVSIQHLNLAPLLDDPRQASDITADAQIDVQAESFSALDSLRGSALVRAPHIEAAGYSLDRLNANATFAGRRVTLTADTDGYGASITAAGHVVIPQREEPIALDLRGRARQINLRKLPRSLNAPIVDTDVNADYRVVGTLPTSAAQMRTTSHLDAALTFASSAVPGARIERGSTAWLTVRGKQIAYRADAHVRDVNLQTIGEAFRIPALADARYATTINGHVVAEGSGTTAATLRLNANGTLSDTTLAGGQVPNLTFAADVADEVAHITANGGFAAVDPSVLTGRAEAKGNLSGDLTVDATITGIAGEIGPDNVSATARVNLVPSEVGGLAIDHAALDADYRDQIADIRQLSITGRDLNISASGALALSDSGGSQLAFHADSSRLEEIGRILDHPLAGIAAVDGTITGNRRELVATGKLAADGVKYGDNGALSLDTTYTARVPDLSFARAKIETDSRATFVTVAGQNINELTGKGTYEDRRVTFDAAATQPKRSLNAAGALILHPDHQEVHLERLDLSAGDQQWKVAGDQPPTIRYREAGIDVEGLRLVSGDQQLSAEGRFGRPGDELKVTLENVDLAGIDALLLRAPQFTGRLNASSVVAGTKEAPRVAGEFQVRQGGFRQFTYESLNGTASYTTDGVDLDARLQQNATQWLTAKGHVPVGLFKRSEEPPASEETHAEPQSVADRIDLAIDSSPLGLGLIQGFTPDLIDVQGTVEAHVRVVGSARDPHPTGSIRIADGALTVVPTGVAYSHIVGNIELQPDRIHINEITVLDNHDSALSVSGDLAVHGREVGAAQLWVTAEDFKVVDNKLGNVRINSAIELAGRLRSPQVKGDLSIATGRVNLDDVMALTGPSVYSTQEAQYAEAEAQAGAAPSIFDALQMNLRISVPNDLIVRASNLQTPGSTIGLGALNVTLGGDLTAMKQAGGRLRLVGEVNTVRGTYDFQGRRFEILRDGTIRFEGSEQLNPSLDLRTQRLIQGVEARVNVRGTMREPEIILSSTPPLEQADILSLIVFNQPVNELGAGQQVSLGQRAQALAAGAVAGQLAQSIGTALNVDTFEIDVAPESGGGPQLTIGQQLGQNLYFKVQQGVGADSVTNVVLEYELSRWLRLQTNVVQGASIQPSMFRRRQGSGADLIFLFEK